MLIFIKNTPRSYAWGSRDAIPELLGQTPTGEPQAELWLGTHPGSPASVAKATPETHTLIDLVNSDPELYGVRGGPLPFLLKVLAIEAPLSLQVHPDLEQARAGFAREEAAGVPRDAPDRNYGDPNHKPELLVALTELSALSGFRPIAEAREDLYALAQRAQEIGENRGGGASAAAALTRAAELLWAESPGDDTASEAGDRAERSSGADPEAGRRRFLQWAFSGDPADRAQVQAAVAGIAAVVRALPDRATGAAADDAASNDAAAADGPVDRGAEVDEFAVPGEARLGALRSLIDTHPGDPGVLISVLLHLVLLQPGEAISLGARQLHAYLGGVGVEVMAASDNVLRAGLTEKHIDTAELCRILDHAELTDPRMPGTQIAPGVCVWRPGVPDFQLIRARLFDIEATRPGRALPKSTDEAVLETPYPHVLIATAGRVRVERLDAEFSEVASVRRGQSLYISSGSPVRLSGEGEVFLATVGE